MIKISHKDMLARLKERSGALFAPGEKHRYLLWRIDEGRATIKRFELMMFVGLNPSTADALTDDNTVRRCRRFARDHGFRGLLMTNMFAYRTRWPKVLYQAEKDGVNIVGEENDAYLHWAARFAGQVVVAWGAVPGRAIVRATHLSGVLRRDLWCFGKTQDGHPRHPLFLRADTKLERWSPGDCLKL